VSRITVFAAVNTKIRYMMGDFLKAEDYNNMLQKSTVSEIAQYLKENTSFSGYLDINYFEMVNRRDIEDALKRNMIKNLDRLIYYFRGDYKEFVKCLYLRYEIEDLKVLARIILNGKHPKDIDKSLAFLGKYSRCAPERLFESGNLRDLIYALKGTKYYEYVEPIPDVERENLFRFEMALDSSYFSIIQNAWNNLPVRDRELLKQWEGVLADILNIQWIYRGKKFYNLMPAELLNYTIDFGNKLNFAKLKAICYSRNLDELYEIARGVGYGFLFKSEETRDIYMERRMQRYIYYRLKSLVKKAPLSIIQIVAYISFLEFQIRDIISIIECTRYRMSPDDTKKFLVRAV
jgi:V/A-type H+-transporting ATPase subunit C